MLAKQQKLAQEILLLQKQINILPDGKFICARNHKHYKWYQSNGHTKTYIPKQNQELAEQLAYKNYLVLQMQELLQEKKCVDAYIQSYKPLRQKADDLLLQSPEYQKLLAPYFTSMSHEFSDWMNAPYPRNQMYPKQLIHRNNSGIVPSINLITTYETKMYPLNSDAVIKLVENYFLS